MADTARKLLGLSQQPKTPAGWWRAFTISFGLAKPEPKGLPMLPFFVGGLMVGTTGVAYAMYQGIQKKIDSTVARIDALPTRDLARRVATLEQAASAARAPEEAAE
mgnify:CR=1 FL=1